MPRLLLPLVVACLLSAADRAVAAEPDSRLTLDLQPSVLDLYADQSAVVRLTVANDGATVAGSISPRWQTNGLATVESLGGDDDSPTLASGESALWFFRVSKKTSTPGIAHVAVSFASGENQALRRVVATSLELRRKPVEQIGERVTAEVHAPTTSLVGEQTTPVYLTLTNKSGDAVRVLRVNPITKPFTISKEGRAALPYTLDPGSSMTLTYALAADATTKPAQGTHLLLFECDLESDNPTSKGTVLATQEMSYAVLGASEILTVLGVPSLLLLPGFLMVMAGALLWKTNWRPQGVPKDQAFPLDPKTAEFWTVAITLSLLTSLVVTKGLKSDIYANYNLGDLTYLWTASILFGAFAYVAYVTAKRVSARRARSHAFSERDQPLDTLGKLARNAPAELETCRALIEKQGVECFLLKHEDGELWVAPAISIKWKSEAPAETRACVDNERGGKGTAGRLHALLQDAWRKGLVEIDWRKQAGLRSPKQISSNTVERFGPREAFVEEG